ncbi:MAG: transposase [Rubrivivax sp.]|nr:transposase [Rubrivivax sp.]
MAWNTHLRFSLNARMDSFLLGHVLAFAAFGGVARVLLYDNLKSAVLERVDHASGSAIRFNADLLAFAAAHRYEPRPVAVARGNEKGRVERSIRYIRDNFFAARTFTDLDDLNAQARAWCEGHACDRRWPEDDRLTVRQAWVVEQASLMTLPENDYPVAERVQVHAGKTPYVRFDLNDYSIPHTHVRRTLTVLAEPERLRVLDGAAVLATHRRSWDRGAQIEQQEHLQALVDHKRGARAHRATDRLTQAVPAVAELLQRAAARGHNLGAVTLGLSRLLDRYGATPMQPAVLEALARDVPHPNAVRLALERAREATRTPPPVDTPLSERARSMDVMVQAHGLAAYDALCPRTEPTGKPTTPSTPAPTHSEDEP